MNQFAECYRGRRVLLTGHTGFKGSWLAAWLVELGADVVGFSLPSDPEEKVSHWDALGLQIPDLRGDIRDADELHHVIGTHRPEIVFHLAAQALVRRSYRDPLESWSTNVMGTANVLELCRRASSVRAVVVITTDKVYANNEWPWGYREVDRLGGYDPYSASKAACELVVDSYRKAFGHADSAPLMATARAGNVIGGGDWSDDRLIPDLVRAVQLRASLEIRAPQATRPWQHVLECLSGYLLLGQRLLEGKAEFADAWNFGPLPEGNRTVAEVLTALQRFWPELAWNTSAAMQPHEANLLYLDCAKASSHLQWAPVWSFEKSIEMTADWYRAFQATGSARTTEQLGRYLESARAAGRSWIV